MSHSWGRPSLRYIVMGVSEGWTQNSSFPGRAQNHFLIDAVKLFQ